MLYPFDLRLWYEASKPSNSQCCGTLDRFWVTIFRSQTRNARTQTQSCTICAYKFLFLVYMSPQRRLILRLGLKPCDLDSYSNVSDLDLDSVGEDSDLVGGDSTTALVTTGVGLYCKIRYNINSQLRGLLFRSSQHFTHLNWKSELSNSTLMYYKFALICTCIIFGFNSMVG